MDELKLRDRPTERGPVARVRNRVLEASLRDADRARGDPEASAFNGGHGDAEAVALVPEQGVWAEANVVEHDLTRAERPEPELVLVRVQDQAGRVTRDDERGDATVAQRAIEARERDEERGDVEVRDPGLGAVEHEIAPVTPVGRGQGRDVAARAWLGHRGGAEYVTLGQRPQPAVLLFLCAEALDAGSDQPGRHRGQGAEDLAGLGYLLDQGDEGDEVETRPSELDGYDPSEQAERGHLVEQIGWEHLFAVVVGDPRRNLAGGEVGGHLDYRPALSGVRIPVHPARIRAFTSDAHCSSRVHGC